MWKAVSTGDGYFKLVPQNAPEYCLDVSGPIPMIILTGRIY